ncbi:PdaC/SigV domain-containing protein [Algoriphagus sediminis]|uniref:DUF4163 domain-containing protein n=1 Tax=Algoriphagus sediminis TaxID=3057113 RepID=A0ABT7YGE4_9BACT|nr:DUF4163 domain-containing protein [Algoriphagus sediminis]MDN3205543.1 DUF4163 domain-containing protein [Algoriphagus sediminis]
MKQVIILFCFIILSSCMSDKDSQKYYFSTQSLSKEGCAGANCAKVNFSWPHLENHPDSSKINSMIEAKLENYILSADSTPSGDFGAQSFLDEYLQIKKEFPDMSGEWFIDVKAEVLFDSLGLVTIQFYNEGYTGGAHGNYSWDFLNFDLETGNELKNEDLILDEEALLKITERKFREFHEVKDGVDLISTGFFDIPESGFFLPRAMGYSGSNFKLIYNSYEIGPYALGPTELEIDLKELKGIVKMD